MKKITLSAALIAAMSTFAIAGGDIAPVEPVVEEIIVEETGAFYLGLAYSAGNLDSTTDSRITDPLTGATLDFSSSSDEDYSAVMLQAGYKFNQYVAIEGRYWIGLSETISTDIRFGDADLTVDTWGIYVKPMYPVTEAFNIYALLGYASSDVSVEQAGFTFDPNYDLDGFSWGIGADYAFGENWAVFVDYVNMYDDENSLSAISTVDDTISTWNFGVTYTF